MLAAATELVVLGVPFEDRDKNPHTISMFTEFLVQELTADEDFFGFLRSHTSHVDDMWRAFCAGLLAGKLAQEAKVGA